MEAQVRLMGFDVGGQAPSPESQALPEAPETILLAPPEGASPAHPCETSPPPTQKTTNLCCLSQ